MMAPHKPFTVRDIARMWGEERGQPVSVETVMDYVKLSRPTPPGAARLNRYECNPVPAPTYPNDNGTGIHGMHPVWVPEPGETFEDLERRIRQWWHSRRGKGNHGAAAVVDQRLSHLQRVDPELADWVRGTLRGNPVPGDTR